MSNDRDSVCFTDDQRLKIKKEQTRFVTEESPEDEGKTYQIDELFEPSLIYGDGGIYEDNAVYARFDKEKYSIDPCTQDDDCRFLR